MIDAMTAARQRIGKMDIALTVLLTALGVLLMVENVNDPKVNASALAIPVFLLVTLPLLWRSVAPLTAIAAVLAGWLIHVAIFGTDVVRCGVVLPVTFVLAFAAGARLEKNDARKALALALLVILGESIAFFGAFGLFVSAIVGIVWYVGRVVRSRAELADELQARTVELRQARDERARLEVATDRARVAGELDELLQRRLGELSRLAEAGAGVTDAETASSTLADIERASRRTLEEMRAVVGVLRSEDEAPTDPQPTLTHLDALLVRAKGADARLVVEGNPRTLPAGVELSAYRVVEHLLDALDDAPGVEVRVHFEDSALEIEVSGPARRRGQAAIERARERVELHSGTLTATMRGGRADAVVQLPVLVEA
jgi:signal transduction histidine kinase